MQKVADRDDLNKLIDALVNVIRAVDAIEKHAEMPDATRAEVRTGTRMALATVHQIEAGMTD